MYNRTADVDTLLNALDESAGRSADSGKRRAARRSWRKRIRVTITHPGGDRHRIEVVTRNLSSGGLSFLHLGFLYVGTRCELQLVTSDNAWTDVQATVVRCRYIAGRAHEIGLRFDEPVDDSRIVSQHLTATVLLIDDADDILRLTAHFLRKCGADVVTAGSGEQALKLIADHSFDLVVVDVEMPGISGPQVARALRDRGITVPVIAYTAHDDPATREECLASGCSEVLIKPLSNADLVDALARYLTVEELIVSSHAADPEMTEFIGEFVNSLPGRIRDMQDCIPRQKTETLLSLARQLKIAASDKGGCGFSPLSEAADTLIGTLSENVNWGMVEQAMSSLSDLTHRVSHSSAVGASPAGPALGPERR